MSAKGIRGHCGMSCNMIFHFSSAWKKPRIWFENHGAMMLLWKKGTEILTSSSSTTTSLLEIHLSKRNPINQHKFPLHLLQDLRHENLTGLVHLKAGSLHPKSKRTTTELLLERHHDVVDLYFCAPFLFKSVKPTKTQQKPESLGPPNPTRCAVGDDDYCAHPQHTVRSSNPSVKEEKERSNVNYSWTKASSPGWFNWW